MVLIHTLYSNAFRSINLFLNLTNTNMLSRSDQDLMTNYWIRIPLLSPAVPVVDSQLGFNVTHSIVGAVL